MNETLPDKGKDREKNRLYFPELDGLRFFAFLLVFLHHHELLSGIPYLSFLHTHGWIGVDLFFSLSAFLFTKLLIAEFQKTGSISFKKFYVRRIFRIWPIYVLFILFSIALYYYFGGSSGDHAGIRIIGLLTFSDNIMTAIYGYNPMPYIAHLWTITYEEQFYIFIPIIILSMVRSSAKRKLLFFVSVFGLLQLIRIVFIANQIQNPAIWVLPITHFESIVLGIALGFGGFDFLSKWIKPIAALFLGVILFIMLGVFPKNDTISYWLIASYSLVGLSTSMVLYAVLNSNFLKTIFSKDLFVFLGKRSYGLYLYHLLGNGIASIIMAKATYLPQGHLASFFYSLTFTIVVSVLSYKYIETPFLKLKQRFEVVTSRPI
jgi:peptidoglycan/LPS O-acetylase OafA/YrhL